MSDSLFTFQCAFPFVNKFDVKSYSALNFLFCLKKKKNVVIISFSICFASYQTITITEN